jgi:dihydrofolate reductase
LLAADLIDELHLLINPVLIGKGLTIFDRIAAPVSLELKQARAFGAGMALLHYARQ